MKKCSVKGCNGKHKAKGYCFKHYMQVRTYGEIKERTRYDSNEIVLYDDYAEVILYDKNCEEVARALIDLEDIDKVKSYKWCLSHGYAFNKKNNITLHRFIMDCPEDMVVDHINHNRLDNRKCNLRICTQQQNCMNRKFMSNNTSGCIGVSWDKSKNKWTSQIMLNNKYIYLGCYDTKEEAIKARKQAEIDLFGEYRNNDEDVS